MSAHDAAHQSGGTGAGRIIDGNATTLARLSGNRCRCAACGEHFHSVGAFDMHRTGTYQPLTRRCLSPDEMRSAGRVQRANGFWMTGKKPGLSPRVGRSGDDLPDAA